MNGRADAAVWREGARRCGTCGQIAPGRYPEGWRILPPVTYAGRRATGERVTCASCMRADTIKIGQMYASTTAIDVRNAVRQRRCVVGVDWHSHLVWLRTDDAITVAEPAVVPMSGPGPPRSIPHHRLRRCG